MIGGNIEAVLQRCEGSATNAIGERIQTWSDVQTLHGWLDLSAGDSKYTHDTKLQESTHIFICDYVTIDRKPENKRLKVNGHSYDVLLIDDPMELHQHLEIYLKYLGGAFSG
jgi:head-tail adaptor